MQAFRANTFSVRAALNARSHLRVRTSSMTIMATQAPVYEIAVKGDPATGVLADCPFSHRALLTLEEKQVPYVKKYVDLDNKPQWLFDVNPAGSVPVLKDLSTEKWTPDSGVIVDMLEEKFPEPSLGTSSGSPQVGLPIFGAFKDFAKSSPEDSAEKERALLEALDELENYLKSNGGPYIGGTSPCATDMLIMPRLYHISIALPHFRNWSIPAKYEMIHKYMDAFMARDSWKNTYYSPELVIKGWVRHGFEVRK